MDSPSSPPALEIDGRYLQQFFVRCRAAEKKLRLRHELSGPGEWRGGWGKDVLLLRPAEAAPEHRKLVPHAAGGRHDGLAAVQPHGAPRLLCLLPPRRSYLGDASPTQDAIIADLGLSLSEVTLFSRLCIPPLPCNAYTCLMLLGLVFFYAVLALWIIIQRRRDGRRHLQWATCRVYRPQGGETTVLSVLFCLC